MYTKCFKCTNNKCNRNRKEHLEVENGVAPDGINYK